MTSPTTSGPSPKKKLTWLITGCSSGFGLSLARIAQAAGHTVIATSRNPSRTPELVSEIESAVTGSRWLSLDVDSPESAQTIEDLEATGQQIDVLVNNAGFSLLAPAETFAEDELRAHMETMYFGPLRLIRGVLPHMRARRFGVIVNISTGAALEGRESMGAYAGAKAALDGWFPLFFSIHVTCGLPLVFRYLSCLQFRFLLFQCPWYPPSQTYMRIFSH